MNVVKLCVLSLTLGLLYGCASGAKQQNMVYDQTSGLDYDAALYGEIEVAEVAGGEETNPLWTSEISDAAFRDAVEMSLVSQRLWGEDARYALAVELMEVDQPLFGLDFTVTTEVRYCLTDTRTGEVLMDEQVSGQHTATPGDAFIAVKRLRLANEGAGKDNIAGLLEKLAELQIGGEKIALVPAAAH